MRAPGDVREFHMIVLEALGELVEVFGGSRSGQEGPMSTKCCTCQRFLDSQETINSPGWIPGKLQVGSGGSPRKPRVRVFGIFSV